MVADKSIKSLIHWAKKIRENSLKMIAASPGGHPGGTLSVADIISVLYFSELRIRPNEPRWPERDRVILSKGHACAALYAALGLRGFFDETEFSRFRRINGLLEGHPSIKIPGVDAPSGSLGLGLSQGLGMALSCRYSSLNFGVFVILGDGDMQEGGTWEAIMAAGFHKIQNLCAILDYNKIQQEGRVEDTMDFSPVYDKIKSFRWNAIEIDGHDCGEIKSAFTQARNEIHRPTFIIAHTIKGKGVSTMENKSNWHGTVPISKDLLSGSLNELNQ